MILQWALALQHLMAVFMGTLIVPLLTGLSISVTLLFSGISTLIFHFLTRDKIPLFYSCSFVFLGGLSLIVKTCMERGMTQEMGLSYACFGVFVSGLVYIILGQILRRASYDKIMSVFPPVISGSYIIALGIVMAGTSISPIATDWELGVTAICVTILTHYYTKGPLRLMPINMGILAALILALIEGKVDISSTYGAHWIEQPFTRNHLAFNIFENFDWEMMMFSILTIVPLVSVSIVEHIADVLAVSRTTKIDYIRNIGLPRTLSANGLSTMVAAMFGAPPTTAFSQTTGLLMITKACSPTLIRMAAVIMIFLSFSPKFTALIASIPTAAIGGATLIMYGGIMVVGLRSLVEAKVDLSNNHNLVILSTVLVLTVGIRYAMDDSIEVCGISLSALTVAGLAGTLMNFLLPKEKA